MRTDDVLAPAHFHHELMGLPRDGKELNRLLKSFGESVHQEVIRMGVPKIKITYAIKPQMAPETRKALESLLRNKFSFLGAERLEINIRISSQPSYRSFGPANERIKADEIWAEIEQEVERLAQ